MDPDIVVDNLPHATFKGKDTQLEAAIANLKEQIKENPVDIPEPPPYPDKSFKYNKKKEINNEYKELDKPYLIYVQYKPIII